MGSRVLKRRKETSASNTVALVVEIALFVAVPVGTVIWWFVADLERFFSAGEEPWVLAGAVLVMLAIPAWVLIQKFVGYKSKAKPKGRRSK